MGVMRVAVSLGIRMHDGRMVVLLPRNTALPAKASRTFSNVGKIEVLAGEHALADDNHRLGWVQFLSQNSHDISRLRVSFEVDITGLLVTTLEDNLTGRSVRESFENFRQVQHVLASVESRGPWSVLTSLANKLKEPQAPSSLARLGSGDETKYMESFNTTAVESVGWAVGPRAFVESIATSPEITLAILFGVICFIVFRIHTRWQRKYRCAQGDSSHEEKLIARITEAEKALADQQARYEEQLLITERLSVELRVARLLLDQQREEIEATQELSGGLPFIVYDDACEKGKRRYVKIQCPGVTHQDIEIEIVINGAVVKVTRPESHGMCRLNWTKRFQFQLQEGHFEFQEDEVQLALGVLYLPFRAYMPRSKVFRLPHQHLDITSNAMNSSGDILDAGGCAYPSSGQVTSSEFQLLTDSKFDMPLQIMQSSSRRCSALKEGEEEKSLTSEFLRACGEVMPLSNSPFSLPTDSSHDCNSQRSQGSDE